MQLNELTKSLHVALLRQGDDSHSSISEINVQTINNIPGKNLLTNQASGLCENTTVLLK